MQKAKLLLLNQEAQDDLMAVLTVAMSKTSLEHATRIGFIYELLKRSESVKVSDQFTLAQTTAAKLRQLAKDNETDKNITEG